VRSEQNGLQGVCPLAISHSGYPIL
jgi:hypothetical protein